MIFSSKTWDLSAVYNWSILEKSFFIMFNNYCCHAILFWTSLKEDDKKFIILFEDFFIWIIKLFKSTIILIKVNKKPCKILVTFNFTKEHNLFHWTFNSRCQFSVKLATAPWNCMNNSSINFLMKCNYFFECHNL